MLIIMCIAIANQVMTSSILKSTHFSNQVVLLHDEKSKQKLKPCVRCFSLFLKEQYASWSFRTKYFEKKFNLQLLYFPLFHKHLFSPELPHAARLLKTSCFEKNNCICNRDNARDTAACPD